MINIDNFNNYFFPGSFRDLKPSNILIKLKDKDADWATVPCTDITFKLADFDFVRDFEPEGETLPKTNVHSLPYAAIEIKEAFYRAGLEKSLYDSRADMYSLGIIAYELVFGHRPTKLNISGSSKLKLNRYSTCY